MIEIAMRIFRPGVFAGGIALLPAVALGCGACIEDKVAAAYDHAMVIHAAARGQRVVFGAIDGTVEPQRVSERIRGSAAKVKGVQRGTVHVSIEPPAFSFALDPNAQTPEAATRELERRLAMPRLHLTGIRVQ
jgi:hypothetical protein